MKKLLYFLIALMFISVIPEISYAQSNDPFEQQTLKATNRSGRREKKVNRRKVEEQPVQQAAPAPKPEPKPEPKPVVKPSTVKISNPCEEWLDVEFVSLIGSRASQTISLTLKVNNHGLNKEMNIGGAFVGYDSEGEEHTRGWAPEHYKTLTDIPFKTSFEIPGKINPSKTTVMPIMKFNIGDCSIEMRDVPIDWK